MSPYMAQRPCSLAAAGSYFLQSEAPFSVSDSEPASSSAKAGRLVPALKVVVNQRASSVCVKIKRRHEMKEACAS